MVYTLLTFVAVAIAVVAVAVAVIVVVGGGRDNKLLDRPKMIC